MSNYNILTDLRRLVWAALLVKGVNTSGLRHLWVVRKSEWEIAAWHRAVKSG